MTSPRHARLAHVDTVASEPDQHEIGVADREPPSCLTPLHLHLVDRARKKRYDLFEREPKGIGDLTHKVISVGHADSLVADERSAHPSPGVHDIRRRGLPPW